MSRKQYTRHSRFAAFAVALLALAAWVTLITPATVAQSANDLVVSDDEGDVFLGQPGSGAPAPASEAYDITEAKLYSETGEFVQVEITLADMVALGDVPTELTSGAVIAACAEWGGQTLGARVDYIYTGFPRITRATFGTVTSDCSTSAKLAFGPGSYALDVHIEPEENVLRFAFDRHVMAEVAGASAPPKAGEALASFMVIVSDGRETRFDVAGGDQSLTFASNTANLELKAGPDANVPTSIPCEGALQVSSYAIEAGGKRGIPIKLENLATKERTVQLSVETLSGPDWKPAMMPQITVPASTKAGVGNVTVNAIVDTPTGTQHKECTTIRVMAIDPDAPGTFGESAINVIAVNPPSAEENRLYLHADSMAINTCSYQHTWLNTLPVDPTGEANHEIFMAYCRDSIPVLTASANNLLTRLDVNPSHDLVVNTSVTGMVATANLALRSDIIDTRARFTVSLLIGRGTEVESVAQGSEIVTIGATAQDVEIVLPIAFTREFVPEGDPSRIFEASRGLGISILVQPLGPDPNLPDTPGGQVKLIADDTWIELPIDHTIKRNANDPGAQGGLLSLVEAEPLPQFAAPDKPRLFNFTVLNEGAVTDMAVASASIAGPTGWETVIVPPGPYELGPGESGTFTVAVTPVGAKESESGFLDVVVESQSDPTARATMSTKVVVTAQGGVPEQNIPGLDGGKAGGKGLVPAPSLWAVLGFVALAAGVAGRTRRD